MYNDKGVLSEDHLRGSMVEAMDHKELQALLEERWNPHCSVWKI